MAVIGHLLGHKEWCRSITGTYVADATVEEIRPAVERIDEFLDGLFMAPSGVIQFPRSAHAVAKQTVCSTLAALGLIPPQVRMNSIR